MCWSIAAADASGVFDVVVVVAAPGRLADVAAAVARRFPRIRVVAGGATRTDSSWAALDATDATILAIHDAARPFVAPALFARCVESASAEGSGIAGLPLADTVRRADEAGVSVEDLERDGLWQVQTPQAFQRPLLERARAEAGGRSFTDDAAAVGATGARTRMVRGDRRNLKITTAEDLAYARELVAKGLASLYTRAAAPRALPR